MNEKKMVSIAIPCFNEEKIIQHTIEKIVDFFRSALTSYELELIIVNDGSTDKTDEVLASLQKSHSTLRVVEFKVNEGRGAAIRRAIKECSGEYLIFLDADLSYEVEHVKEILAQFQLDPKLGVVIVSPYMKDGVVKNVPIFRYILSWTANWLISGFFSKKISTVTCVVRGYNASIIKSLLLIENGKEIHLEILRKLFLKGVSFKEIPGRLIWKKADKSRGKRFNRSTMYGSIKSHIWWGIVNAPTRLLKYPTLFLIIIAIYESITLFINFLVHFQPNKTLAYATWQGLAEAFRSSPHTVVITCVALIMATTLCAFMGLIQVLKMQQEESMKQLQAIWEQLKKNDL